MIRCRATLDNTTYSNANNNGIDNDIHSTANYLKSNSNHNESNLNTLENGNSLNNQEMEQQDNTDKDHGTPSRSGNQRSKPRPKPGGGPYQTSTHGVPLRPNPDFPLRILVLSDMVGAIIGKSGGTIRQITQETRARVDVHRKENTGSPEKVITIYGNPDNCSKACRRIVEVMTDEAANTTNQEVVLKILAHNSLIGRIIGKSGNTIKRIMEETNTKIAVSSSMHDSASFHLERIITIKGTVDEMCRAEQQISSKLRQSFER